MEEILKDLSGPALVQAIEANLTAFLRDQARSPEVEWHEEPELSWYITGIGYHNFNRIVRSQFKRRLPVIAKVSTRSVGWDFRYPRDWKS